MIYFHNIYFLSNFVLSFPIRRSFGFTPTPRPAQPEYSSQQLMNKVTNAAVSAASSCVPQRGVDKTVNGNISERASAGSVRSEKSTPMSEGTDSTRKTLCVTPSIAGYDLLKKIGTPQEWFGLGASALTSEAPKKPVPQQSVSSSSTKVITLVEIFEVEILVNKAKFWFLSRNFC